MGRVVPRSGAWPGCPLVLGPLTFCGVRGRGWDLPWIGPCRCLWSVSLSVDLREPAWMAWGCRLWDRGDVRPGNGELA